MNPVVERMDVDVPFTTKYPEDLTEDNEGVVVCDKMLQLPTQNDVGSEETTTTGITIVGGEEKEETGEIDSESKGLKSPTLEKDENDYLSRDVAEGRRNTRKLGPNTVHTRGTEDTSTKDVFKCLEDYPPMEFDWVDDVSCMRGPSTESRKRMYREAYHSKQQSSEEVTERTSKKHCKNPWGTLSRTWGKNDATEDDRYKPKLVVRKTNNDVKERLGLKPSIKTTLYPAEPSEDDECNIRSNGEKSDDEWCRRSKVLRMRMHADDEEKKMLHKRFLKQTAQNMESNCNDLRSRLDSAKKVSVYRRPIQVVVDNTTEEFLERDPHDYEVEDSGAIEPEENESEQEEGEWTDEVEQVEEQSEDEASEESDISEKEVQGPKGSVIKIVPRVKPRVASTVWSRLNNASSGTKMNDRSPRERDCGRNPKGDVRSRLGYHNRNRSPLRIEVKNEKYAEESSDTE